MNLRRSLEQIDDEKIVSCCAMAVPPRKLCGVDLDREPSGSPLYECVRMPASGGLHLQTSFFFLTRGFFFRYARGVLR
jgi:hypothetical protein